MSTHSVLVVDDDPVSLRVIDTHLQDAGYSVISLASGELALQLLSQPGNPYAMVLVDRLLADMDGMEFIYRVRASEHLKSIPLVVLTAQADADEHIDLVGAGVFDVIYKPIDYALLLHTVDKALHWAFVDDASVWVSLRACVSLCFAIDFLGRRNEGLEWVGTCFLFVKKIKCSIFLL